MMKRAYRLRFGLTWERDRRRDWGWFRLWLQGSPGYGPEDVEEDLRVCGTLLLAPRLLDSPLGFCLLRPLPLQRSPPFQERSVPTAP